MSNHIGHIEITNFKSIRHQRIEGCKRINVFIGYPNVGKSAILEAISSLGYLQKDYYDAFNKLCRLKESFELFYDANTKEEAVIKVNNEVDIKFKYLSETDIEFSLYKPMQLAHNLKGASSKKIVFSKGERQTTSSNLDKDILKVKKYHFRDVYNTHKTSGLTLFFPFGENLVDIIHLNKSVRKEVSELFKFYNLKLLIDPSTNTVRGFKQLDEEIVFTIPYYQMADTLQRLIFHKAAIMSNENSVLLFEEPEAHMFPPYIRKFTEDIIFNKENGNQYFISTHSPFVLDDLIEDAREDLSVYLVGLKNGETIIKRLSDEELEEVHKMHVDLFFNIESYLD